MLSKRVLIVDDEENLRLLLRVILEKAGYQCVCASDGGRGLAALRDDPTIRIALCDIRMPNMDGLAFLRETRMLQEPPYVVMMSAYGDADSAISTIKRGAFDFVSKPFKGDEIVFCIKKIEERERLFRENSELRQELERKDEELEQKDEGLRLSERL